MIVPVLVRLFLQVQGHSEISGGQVPLHFDC